MKTLTQVEPRTLISSLPYFITNSGSYYLTGDLIGTAGQAGIVISASNVSIDLMGFSITGSSNGISVSGAGLGGVAVHNGTVRQCAGPGINLGSVQRCQIEHVLVSANGGAGMVVGSAALVDLCTATGNSGIGISAGDGSSVFSCVVQSNTADGILVTAQSRVAENTCDSNGSGLTQAAIHSTGAGNRIEANNLSRNNAHGIKVEGTNNLVIKNSACSSTGTDYDIASGNNYGQILVGPGSGFTNSNPWANFSCAAVVAGCVNDSQCDDGNACTTDLCSLASGTCSHTFVANGTACPGGTCNSGVCQATGTCASAADCPGVDTACHFRTCTAGTCGFSNAAAGTACSDGNACTTGDVCDGAGTCNPGAPVVCGEDGNPCTGGGICNPGTGVCSYPNVPDLTACPGGACHSGVCQTSCTTDANCATNQYCSGGVCVTKSAAGAACASNNQCGSGVCQFGFCQNPSCTDAIKNGTETDIDCGGGTCVTCVNGKMCGGNGDCQSGLCQGGVCTINCTAGQVNCGGTCRNLSNDVNNCGSCGNLCSAPNATSSCASGTCTIAACNAGFSNCDNVTANGCEVSVNTDPNNCGNCGTVCSSSHIAIQSCASGVCNGACTAGFADCNGNKQSDGCETNVATNTNNCGGCGIVCSANHITAACSGSVCNGTCTAGFADCNGNKQSDGCEINVTNDHNNCGTCGHVCPGAQTCISSVCQ
ncbi:MAG: hypothetical protein JWR19_3531 [Pedosphaera sp.]|nr:hypothetical protein [Pedosphaera sp.]